MTAVKPADSSVSEVSFSSLEDTYAALQNAKQAFLHRYRTEFGFDLPDRYDGHSRRSFICLFAVA